jgi:hypothetical protein
MGKGGTDASFSSFRSFVIERLRHDDLGNAASGEFSETKNSIVEILIPRNDLESLFNKSVYPDWLGS